MNKKIAKSSKFYFLLLQSLLVGILITGCAGTQSDTHSVNLASINSMPEEVRDAPVSVQQAYQFAVANPEVMTQIPCYCGCGSMGHTSNYACYVSGKSDDGQIQFDTHALGCSICVDITLDTMRMLEQGKPVNEIRSVIDETYSQYGPSNIP